MLRVDAHHHLWRYNTAEFDWLQGPLAPLRQDFLATQLREAAQSAGVSGTVAVQARQNVEETDWLLEIASATPLILGVVGWLPLRSADFSALLARYASQPKLRGLRHVVQGEREGFMEGATFRRGITALRGTGLVYDILIHERQLEEATRLVDAHPDQVFVLDHIAKPKIAAGELQPWAKRIQALAQRPNIFCKISGMVTEADPMHWSEEQLRPYFDVVLEAFTPARLMAGSDWPVLLAGTTYQRWWELLAAWMRDLSAEEQAAILGQTTLKAYGLQAPAATNHLEIGANV